MLESINDYISRDKAFKVEKTEKVLERDRDILQPLYTQITQDRKRSNSKRSRIYYTIDDLVRQGVSKCTVFIGLQRVYMQNLIHEYSQLTDFERTKDFRKYGLVPGQHLFYYGAFTGYYLPSSLSFATHHFVYIGRGLTVEVGSDSFDKVCLDGQELFNPYDVKSQTYKRNMNYFGISSLYETVKFAKTVYHEKDILIYRYPNDFSKEVIIERLNRARKIIGKWAYSLSILSNNCENAANYVSLGHSISTQAYVSDICYNVVGKAASTLGAAVSSLFGGKAPSEKVCDIEGSKYRQYFTNEGTLRYKTDIPPCDKKGSYAEKFVSDKQLFCDGVPEGDEIGEFGYVDFVCKVDKRYCIGRDCPEKDKIATPFRIEKICRKGKGDYQLLDD